ncbi:MAG TPA: amidohydrolase family protein [Gammaproteobacteria bacterium]|nr:amidohydrolase family protein [Gammaproteobacteria bacterium]
MKTDLGFKRIATEEAFLTKEIGKAYRDLLARKGSNDIGFNSLVGYYQTHKSERSTAVAARLEDLGERRIADMDASGVDVQILSLTSPGVQVFDAATAVGYARSANDELAEAIAKYPTRYAGLAAVAPQDPAAAAKELERGVTKLGLKGAIINSHTQGEYLDNEKFWDILAAAEALDVPIYIHPNTPPNAMIQPFLERGLDGAVFGFAVETGLHALRIVVSGALDRFPKLKIVLGHLGEGLPFWLFRLDHMHGAALRAKRYACCPPLERKVSEYLKQNFYYTTSGMAWSPPILYVQQVMGVDRLMYAMDYPYQFVPEEVNVTDALPIGYEDHKAFYQTNAERVFRL